MTESQWFNTSDHTIAVGFRALKGMLRDIPGDPSIRKQMRLLVLRAREEKLTAPTIRQSLIASSVLWESE